MSSKEEPTQVELDFEALNWDQALETFKSRHENNDRRQAFLACQTNGPSVKKTCQKLQSESDQKYRKGLGGILEKIDALMTLGDIAIKSAPESVGLAWMGVRMCLHAVQGDFATFQLFSGACADIVGIMISCRVYGKMFGHKEGPDDFQELHQQVADSMPGIYTDILDFSYAVRKYTDKHLVIRIGKNIFMDQKTRFQAMMDALRQHETEMRDFAKIATDRWLVHYQKDGLKNQDVMMADVSFMKDALAINLRTNEAFVRHIEALEEERKDMRRKAPEEKARDEYEENCKLLNPANDQSDVLADNLNNLREPGTCRWIFDLEEYRQWYASDKSAMLWVSGAGGYGKSILMSTVVEFLQAEFPTPEDCVVQYFFCKTGNDGTQATTRILQTLLYQLYARSDTSTCGLEGANEVMRSALGRKPGEQATSQKKTLNYETTYVNLLKAMKCNVFLVIDALDECIDREEKNLIQSLHKCITMAPDAHLKIMVCSRPESDIGNSLQNVPTIKCEGHNEGDIRKNVTAEMDKFPGWTASEKLLACDEVVRKAGGQFRYVSIALNFLRKPLVRPFSHALRRLPNGLIGSYITSWDNTDPEYLDLLKVALNWTMLSEGIITVAEVMDAYSRTYSAEAGIQEDQEEAKGHQGEAELYDQQVRIAGGNFLDVSSTHTISLRHTTVRDFFTERKQDESQLAKSDNATDAAGDAVVQSETTSEPTSKWFVSQKEGHLAILKVLAQNLVSPVFQKRHLFSHDELKSASRGRAPDTNGINETHANKLVGSVAPKGNAHDRSEDSTEKQNTTTGADHQSEDSADGTKLDKQVLEEIPQSSDRPVQEEPIDSDDGQSEAVDYYDDGMWLDDEEKVNGQTEGFGDRTRDNPELASTRRKYRYELTHWHHHLFEAEQLWPSNERESNPDWAEALQNLYHFMYNSPEAFQAYCTLMSRDTTSDLYTGMINTVYTPLQIAARYGTTSLAELCIKKGHDLNERTTFQTVDVWHQSALEICIDESRDPDLRMARLLLESGVDPNTFHDGPTAFHWACEMKPSVVCIQLFLDFGAKLNVQDQWGSNVMHYFAESGSDPKELELLIKAGGDVNNVNWCGETPLHWFVDRYGELPIELLEAFLEAGTKVDVDDNKSQRPLFGLAARGNLKAVELLFQHGADVHDDNTRGLTALHAAALAGSTEIVKMLVEKGAEVNRTDKIGRTPFYFACQGGHEQTAQYLLELLQTLPVDEINKADNKGRTPFRKAAAGGSLNIMKLLLPKIDAANAINAPDTKTGQTAVHRAAYNGEKGALEVLLEAGADVSLTDKQGRTPLQLCAQGWAETDSESNEDTLLLLVETNKAMAIKCPEVLFIAAMKGSTRVIQRLLNIGADPNMKDEHGWTALLVAEQYSQPKVVELLNKRQIVVRLGPTRWLSPAKHIRLHDNDLEIQETSKTRKVTTVTSDHPIPAGVRRYYFEVTLLKVPPIPKDLNQVPIVGVGLVPMPVQLIGVLPGLRGWAWFSNHGFIVHGDDEGTLYGGGPFGTSDVIGCAIDFDDQSIFYTRNGQRHSVGFRNVFGRLFPTVGMASNVTIRANFGTDLKKTPFSWDGWQEWQSGEKRSTKPRERSSSTTSTSWSTEEFLPNA